MEEVSEEGVYDEIAAVATSEEDEVRDEIEDSKDEAEDREDGFGVDEDFANEYGSPTPEELNNQWSIIKNAIDKDDALRTTLLLPEELGRPLFSVRFYMDLKYLSEYYNAPILSNYFESKVKNITSSGMSREGFIMNLAATRRRETTRKRAPLPHEKDSLDKEKRTGI